MRASNHYTLQNCIARNPVREESVRQKVGRQLRTKRGLLPYALCLLVIGSMLAQILLAGGRTAEALNGTGAPAASQYFGVTGKSVSGSFLQTFNRFGLQAIGYPLSDPVQQSGMTVQYFERVRMEYHPETATKGYPVLMTRLGDDLSRPAQPFARVASFKSSAARAYFNVTGHSLSEPFLSFWKAHGAVELYGYPLSEPMTQGGLLVQWFERARFEYHPELAKTGQVVQLSLLGKEALQKAGALALPIAPPPAQPQVEPAHSAPVAQAGLTGMESYVLQKVNEQRAAVGLGPVTLNAQVTDVARARSNDMADRNYFSHTTPEGTNFLVMLTDHSIQYKFAGEILARNNYPDDQAAEVAFNSYLNSPPHKAIIMDGRYNQVGVGYSKSGAEAMHYFTVIFVQK